jgi:hypothetical protein
MKAFWCHPLTSIDQWCLDLVVLLSFKRPDIFLDFLDLFFDPLPCKFDDFGNSIVVRIRRATLSKKITNPRLFQHTVLRC